MYLPHARSNKLLEIQSIRKIIKFLNFYQFRFLGKCYYHDDVIVEGLLFNFCLNSIPFNYLHISPTQFGVLTFETSNNLLQTISCDLIYINNIMFMVGIIIIIFFLVCVLGQVQLLKTIPMEPKYLGRSPICSNFLVFFPNLLRITNSRGPNFIWPIKRELLYN